MCQPERLHDNIFWFCKIRRTKRGERGRPASLLLEHPPVLALVARAKKGAALVGRARLLLVPPNVDRPALPALDNGRKRDVVERLVLGLKHPMESLLSLKATRLHAL